MLRWFFSYVSPDPLPEVPEEEPPDPNAERALSEAYRTARRHLVAVSAICLAWSAAQFTVPKFSIEAVGITLDLQNGSLPLLLGLALMYLTTRWLLEYAMMPRLVRRWPLAKLDFRVVSIVSRCSFLALAA